MNFPAGAPSNDMMAHGPTMEGPRFFFNQDYSIFFSVRGVRDAELGYEYTLNLFNDGFAELHFRDYMEQTPPDPFQQRVLHGASLKEVLKLGRKQGLSERSEGQLIDEMEKGLQKYRSVFEFGLDEVRKYEEDPDAG